MIRTAVQHWETQTCIRFRELSDDYNSRSEPYLLFTKKSGCGSYIGKVNIIPQPIDLVRRCLTQVGVHLISQFSFTVYCYPSVNLESRSLQFTFQMQDVVDRLLMIKFLIT